MSPEARATLDTVVSTAAAHAAEVDREGVFPVATLAELRRSGLMGLLVSEEYGGQGAGLAELVEVTQRLGGVCLSSAMMFSMHCQQVDALVCYASPALRERLLPDISAGDLYLGSVTTETSTGGNLLTSATALTAEDGVVRLDREAPVVTGGRHADGFLITVRSSPEATRQDISLVYANRDQLDIEVTGGWDALGMRGVENVALRLRGDVPDYQVVGGFGRFREIAIESFGPLAFLGWSAGWLGATRHTWSALLVQLRQAGGRIDLQSSSVTERVARIRCHLEIVSSYLHTMLNEVQELRRRGLPVNVPATQIRLNSLKLIASEQCLAAARAMVELVGLDLGYRRDAPVPVERLVRDLTSASLTYSNARLFSANGALSVLDPAVSLAPAPHYEGID